MPRSSTIEAIYIVRHLMVKHKDHKKDLYIYEPTVVDLSLNLNRSSTTFIL